VALVSRHPILPGATTPQRGHALGYPRAGAPCTAKAQDSCANLATMKLGICIIGFALANLASGAISRDNFADLGHYGPCLTCTTPAYKINGTDTTLLVAIDVSAGVRATGSVSWNGISLTRIDSPLHGDSLDVWWAVGLKPGSAPIVIGSDYAHGFRVLAASYSGVAGIDRYPAKTALNLGNAPVTTSLTTTIDGDWLVLFGNAPGGVGYNGGVTGAIQVLVASGDSGALVDSGGPVSPGNHDITTQVNWMGPDYSNAILAFALAPLKATQNVTSLTVQVLGTTATQAVLAYTAPDNNPCSVAVSQSQSLMPLVPDVDPSLFSWSNLDNRPLAINNGTQRVFVAGKRSADLSNGVRVSRALQVATRHYYSVTCGSLSASGTFTTANLASGNAYPEYPPQDPNSPGDYAWPDMPYSASTPSMIEPTTGLLVRPLTHPGEDTSYWPSGAQTDFCSPTLSNGGYHCILDHSLYWISPTTGESRFLGRFGFNMYFSLSGDNLGGASCEADGATFSPTDANTWYCQANAVAGAVLLRATYVGSDGAANPGDMAPVAWANLTPISQGQSLQSKAHAFDPTFDPNVFAAGPEVRGGLGNGMIALDFKRSGQDSPGWLTVFDPATQQFVAMASTGNVAIHSYTPVLQSTEWVGVTCSPPGCGSAWHFSADPHGASVQVDPKNIGHGFSADKALAGSTGGGISIRTGTNFTEAFPSAGKSVIYGLPILGHSPIAFENFVEDYTAEGDFSGNWVLNAKPIEAANDITAISRVSGQLFQVGMNVLDSGASGTAGSRRKIFPTFAYCGSHPMVDVSGPGSTIDDSAADSYKYCVAEADGECRDSAHSRSTRYGEIYANCPGNDGTTCGGAEGNRGICMVELGSFSGPLSQLDAKMPQNWNGQDVRALTWGFRPFHFDGAYYWSGRTLPDGSWIIVRANGYQRSGNADFLMKMPPMFSQDGVSRNGYVPVTVNIPAQPGAAGAKVLFGYAENGAPNSFYCTSRREACVSVDALGQRSGKFAVYNGSLSSQSGDAFDVVTWKPGTRIRLEGTEWPIAGISGSTVTIAPLTGLGTVSASGNTVTFSYPGECSRHLNGSRINVGGTTVTVNNPWVCGGTASDNRVGVDTPVSWSNAPWSWDLGNLNQNSAKWSSVFRFASEAFNLQPCANGCTIVVPAVSQRVLYYQVVYDSGAALPVQVLAVP